ncbi:substrate-binding domain-containing protein [Butyrivibrio sp. MC2021]|uniref:substrate-binding domain-containing protein n=1 Tax=Butyrivibrio sp. MC2021 TaxID=1408306 RepID=UPI000478E06C|nr:substrate-binding domain-containing protein [Butyrivibrio sp. MC2021]
MLKNRILKRVFACVLTGALMVSALTGCQASSSASSSGGGGKGGKLLFIITDTNDTYLATLANAMVEAGKNQGVTLDMVETGNDVQAQMDLISQAKSKGYSAIILRSADANTAVQMNIASNDLPIVYVNSEPSVDHLRADKYIYVGSDENQPGKLQAEYVLKKLGNPKSLNVIIFGGERGHSATVKRTDSVKTTLKNNGVDVNYVFVDYADWSDAIALEKFRIFMKTGQSVDAIFCNNDTMALGAVEGLKEFGLDYTKIPVCGVDASADGCASIAAGEMQFTVLQNAKGQAAAAVTAAATLGGGGSLTSVEGSTTDCKYVYVPFEAVDASNVSQYQ